MVEYIVVCTVHGLHGCCAVLLCAPRRSTRLRRMTAARLLSRCSMQACASRVLRT